MTGLRSVEKDNEPSEALFAAEGFTKTSFSEVSKRHGSLHTVNMYRAMTVVPGESYCASRSAESARSVKII